MAAVDQDLPLQLLGERLVVGGGRALLLGSAQARQVQRRQRRQPRHPIRRVLVVAAEIADLLGQARHHRVVERPVRAIQHDRGVGEPGDDAPGHDLRPPGEGGDAAVEGDPVAHQGAGVLARDLVAGGSQMPEPAEAVQRAFPLARRRPDAEGRFGAGERDGAGQPEMPVIDLAREARVRGPEVLRHDQELMQRAAAIAPAKQPRLQDALQRDPARRRRRPNRIARPVGARIRAHLYYRPLPVPNLALTPRSRGRPLLPRRHILEGRAAHIKCSIGLMARSRGLRRV